MKRKNEAAKMLKKAHEAGTLSNIKYGPMTDQTDLAILTADNSPMAQAVINKIISPSPAAMRAGKAINDLYNSAIYRPQVTDVARIIDRETGLAELRAALENITQQLTDLHAAIADQCISDSFVDDSINMLSEGKTAIAQARAVLGKDA